MSLVPGTRLGPYEVTGRLGAGGMGEVYRATDAKLGRDVAIKVLPSELARDPERLARFEREAKLFTAAIAGTTIPSDSRARVSGVLGGEARDLAAGLNRGSGAGIFRVTLLVEVVGATSGTVGIAWSGSMPGAPLPTRSTRMGPPLRGPARRAVSTVPSLSSPVPARSSWGAPSEMLLEARQASR